MTPPPLGRAFALDAQPIGSCDGFQLSWGTNSSMTQVGTALRAEASELARKVLHCCPAMSARGDDPGDLGAAALAHHFASVSLIAAASFFWGQGCGG